MYYIISPLSGIGIVVAHEKCMLLSATTALGVGLQQVLVSGQQLLLATGTPSNFLL